MKPKFERPKESLPIKPEEPKHSRREAGSERERNQDRVIKELLQKNGELAIAAHEIENIETRHVIQGLCAAIQPLLEEQYHYRHPEEHPETNMGGGQYRHRDEAIGLLELAIKSLRGRDFRTIEVKTDIKKQGAGEKDAETARRLKELRGELGLEGSTPDKNK